MPSIWHGGRGPQPGVKLQRATCYNQTDPLPGTVAARQRPFSVLSSAARTRLPRLILIRGNACGLPGAHSTRVMRQAAGGFSIDTAQRALRRRPQAAPSSGTYAAQRSGAGGSRTRPSASWQEAAHLDQRSSRAQSGTGIRSRAVRPGWIRRGIPRRSVQRSREKHPVRRALRFLDGSSASFET